MDSPVGMAAGIGAVYGTLNEFWKVPAQGLGEQFSAKSVGTSAVKNSFHFAAMGALYTVATSAAETSRGVDDHFNGGLGGASVGAYLGLRQGGLSAMHGIIHRSLALGAAGIFCHYVGSKYRPPVTS